MKQIGLLTILQSSSAFAKASADFSDIKRRRTLARGAPLNLPCLLIGWIFFKLFLSLAMAQEPVMNVHFVDVGYADAILIEWPGGQTMLIDAGDRAHAERLADYLRSYEIERIDTLMITHPHDNHFGGAPLLMRSWPIEKVFTNADTQREGQNRVAGYNELIGEIQAASIPVAVLKQDDRVPLDLEDAEITVLHPPAIDGSINENAIVLWLTYGETAFLLTADIQPEQQEAVLDRYPQIMSADVVLVPHHGGKISERFARAFGPETIFVVSTGENPYGKPFADELNKLKGRIYRTDIHGVLVVSSDGTSLTVTHEE